MKIKTLIIALLALTTTLNFSCSKDKDDDNPNTIIGTWKQLSESIKTITKNPDGTVSESNETITFDDGRYLYITFKSDGKYTSKDKLENKDDDENIEEGTYVINGNKIRIMNSENNEENVFSLTKTKLTVLWVEKGDNISFEHTSIFEKIN